LTSLVTVDPVDFWTLEDDGNSVTTTLLCGSEGCLYTWRPSVPLAGPQPLVAECPKCHTDNLMPVSPID
jgi:hypothetical protein